MIMHANAKNLQQTNMFDMLNMRYRITKPIRLIELFAGIGAQAKSLENIKADFEHYHICEFDKFAVMSYNAMHSTQFETSDITKLFASDLAIVETDKYEYVMTYSFPCQDLSAAGKCRGMQRGADTRSGLLWEVERLINECAELPQILVMENVPDVHNEKNINEFREWLTFLESKGYSNYYKDLNAKDFNVAQNRNRCYMISILGNWYYEFPQAVPLTKNLSDYLESNVDKKYYLSCEVFEAFIKKTQKNMNNKIEFRFELKNETDIARTITTRSNRITDTFIYEIAYGFNYGQSSAFNRLPLKNLSRTLRTNSLDSAVIYKGKVRRLTPLESFRLMEFDDNDYYKCKAAGISDTQLYKQAGNSIVVKVLEEIFKNLLGD